MNFTLLGLQWVPMKTMTYTEAIDYLYSFVDYSVKRKYRYSAEVFQLSRVEQCLHALDDPHLKYRTVHVAGTKGKGSTCSMITSALRAGGYRTGLYTSPHLMRFTERFQVDGREIREQAFADLLSEIKPVVEAVPDLTTYEIATVLMFLYFARENVDVAVLEVGLGGRLDATNVVEPDVCVITSLSYDHMHLLGNSLSDIAREKAGIIKPGVPVVMAPQQYEAIRVVEEVAKELKSPLLKVGQDWHFSHGSRNLDSQIVFIWSDADTPQMEAYIESGCGDEWIPLRYEIPLLGYHQVINCATARVALEVLREAGLNLTEEQIHEGFRKAEWRGRFQVLSRDPIVIIDSAHNRDSALRLRIALDDYFPGQKVTLIFGASADKDITGMFSDLLPRVSRLITTRADHPRAADPKTLAGTASDYGLPVQVEPDIPTSLDNALSMVRPDEVILVAGSIFIAGEAISYWESKQQKNQSNQQD